MVPAPAIRATSADGIPSPPRPRLPRRPPAGPPPGPPRVRPFALLRPPATGARGILRAVPLLLRPHAPWHAGDRRRLLSADPARRAHRVRPRAPAARVSLTTRR